MSGKLFIPKMSHTTEVNESVVDRGVDTGDSLQRIIQYVAVGFFGLLPIFFTPHLWASLGFDKAMLALVAGSLIIVLSCFQTLRRSRVFTVLPLSLGIFWLLVIMSALSAYLTGDIQDSFRGSIFETQTVVFLATIGLVMSLPLVLQNSKKMSLMALVFFSCTSALLLTYNLLRVFFGKDFMAFQSFNTVTMSPVGVFNDLAIFCGLVVIFGLITLSQLPVKAVLRYLIAGLILVALFLLALVNFSSVWLTLGFFALSVLVYLLTKKTLFSDSENVAKATNPLVLMVVTVVVCVVSGMFVVSGEYWGEKISQATGVNYIEVRPSMSATVDIARSVYNEDLLLGTGPNRFSAAWRQYKNPVINQTFYWDTEFIAGNSFISTLFISSGALGGSLMVLFHLAFLYLGYKMLLRTKKTDSFWYYFGVVSFTSAIYLWGLSYVYVPGATILLLAAFFTGLTFVAADALLPSMVRVMPMVTNRRRGFFMMAIIIVVTTGTVAALYSVSKQYSAQSLFNEVRLTATEAVQFESAIDEAYALYKDDRFIAAKAQLKLVEINNLLSIAEPSEDDVKNFAQASGLGVEYAVQAVESDPTNPVYQEVLAGIYSRLIVAEVTGAQERFDTALANAISLDPFNPKYYLIAAQTLVQTGDVAGARERIKEALNLKRNYTQALYLSSQLDIEAGDTGSAIRTVQDIIILEPNNQARYLQLGILLSAAENLPEAELMFKRAIQIDNQYANARYFLGLVYLNTNRPELALQQMMIVRQSNQDNVQLNTLIEQIESGTYSNSATSADALSIDDPAPKAGEENTVTTDVVGDTDLVTPVNTAASREVSDNVADLDSAPETDDLGKKVADDGSDSAL